EFGDADSFALPAFERFVDRLDLAKVMSNGGKRVNTFSVDLVTYTNLYLFESVEDIELCQGDGIETVKLCGISSGDGVKPTTAPGPFCNRAIFISAFSDQIRHVFFGIDHLGRKWPLADTRCVSPNDAENARNVMRRDPRTDRSPAGCRVRRGNVGIGSVVDIEKRRLSTFEKDLLILLAGLRNEVRRFTNVRPKPFDKRCDLVVNIVCIERRLTVKNNDAIRLLKISFDAHLQNVGRQGIRHTNAAASRFVLVGGPNSSQRRSDLFISEPLFRCVVERPVIRHYQMGTARNFQPVGRYTYTLRFHLIDFFKKSFRVDHHTIAADAGF